ncbi:MAG: DUF1015 domain-containing protein [Oscillospiraceae bacterium]
MTAFTSADILLPKDLDFEKWAVIACDQFTAEPEYWEETKAITNGAFSALDLILPEVYLNESGVDERIEKINKNMHRCLDGGVFEEYKDSLIYVERVQTDGIVRAGIVGAVDLEMYDYRKGSTSQVRATEATVVERIPPRIKVRKNAPVELPHIMILIDDAEKKVIEPLSAKKDGMKKLYDFELMQGGGHISGWLVDEETKAEIFGGLDRLADKDAFNEKYGLDGADPLVYAMGDGNHSLATAKEFYEQLKAENPDSDMSGHPARYALAEIVNLHSPALDFEAIYRIVKGVDAEKTAANTIAALELTEGRTEGGQNVGIVIKGETKWYTVGKPTSKLAVGSLQNFLDVYCKEKGADIDYIHGLDVIDRLSMADNAIGFVLDDMAKEELFPTVIADGALPRKTFSMGHAKDKRYYIEARKIICNS